MKQAPKKAIARPANHDAASERREPAPGRPRPPSFALPSGLPGQGNGAPASSAAEEAADRRRARFLLVDGVPVVIFPTPAGGLEVQRFSSSEKQWERAVHLLLGITHGFNEQDENVWVDELTEEELLTRVRSLGGEELPAAEPLP